MAKDPKLFVVHIIDGIEFLNSIIHRMSFEQFKEDPAVSRASTYSLQIISEAARKLPVTWMENHPYIEWHKIKALGNRTRHEYAEISLPVLWNTMLNELEGLYRAMKLMMANPS